MQNLAEEIEELLSRARYLEKKHQNTPMAPEYWARLTAACDQARKLCPDVLKNLVPNETNKTWAEAALCLEVIHDAVQDTQPAAAAR